jgi:hypothetical protein
MPQRRGGWPISGYTLTHEPPIGNGCRVRRAALVCAAAVLLSLPVWCAQSTPATHHAKKPPKPEPTQQELFDYVRSQLLTMSADDGINDNLEVSYDLATSTLSVTRPDGRCNIFLGNLDSNSALWEIFDPSDTYHSREAVLRVTLSSLNGKSARTCYDKHDQVDPSLPPNRTRILFSLARTKASSSFTEDMDKALKKLIAMAGGAPAKDIF